MLRPREVFNNAGFGSSAARGRGVWSLGRAFTAFVQHLPKVLLIALAVTLAACGGDSDAVETTASDTTAPAATNPAPEQGCADVIGVVIEPGESGFTVSATVASADTGWDKYADLWEVRAPDGAVLGERVLAHPHETEQPFTRSVGGVAIPPDVTEVVVAARDSVDGFCGAEYLAEVPHP